MVRSEYLPHSNSLNDLVKDLKLEGVTHDARADLSSTDGESILVYMEYKCFGRMKGQS